MANAVANLVFIPAPVIGHVISTIKIAQLLINRDQRLSITIFIIKRPSTSRSSSAVTTYIQSLSKKPMDHISLIELPQEQTPPDNNSKSPMAFFNELLTKSSKHIKNILTNMMSQPGSGQLAGFVIDMFCTGILDLANELYVPTYVFFTSNAAFLGFMLYIQTLNDDQNEDVVELSNSDSMIRIPVFVNPVPTKVFPTVVQVGDAVDFFLESGRKMKEAKGIMVNTFMELETHAIKSLLSNVSIPRVYPVGPILNLEDGYEERLNDDVVSWLDSQPPSSVVFLCFGSMGSFGEFQVKEIAHALEKSGHRFIWSLRQPPLQNQTSRAPNDYDDLRVVLPEGFLERTCEMGKVIGWAPQVELLAHHAVGGFVTHCGWNSLLESFWFGVPVATWPIYAEQQMNAFEMVVELGLAVEIKLEHKKDLFNPEADNTVIVTKEEIESGIRRLMEDNEVRMKVKEMSEKSRSAVKEGGSSYVSVSRIIEDFMRNIS